VNTFLEVFFAFVAGGFTLWGLLELRRYLDHRAGRNERSEREWLKAHGVQLQQAAARLSKPHVGPPPVQRPTAPPWPYDGRHAWPEDAPGDPKGY
jgi:hypothetical protein